MSLSRLQKIVIRNSLKIARKLNADDDRLYIQVLPSKHDFQVHISSLSTAIDKEILHEVYPEELHELTELYPQRNLDGTMLRNIICSAARLKKFASTSNTERTAVEDLALEAYRRLSIQRKLTKSTSTSVTSGIRVVATAIFDEEYTELSDDRYLYFYRIFFENAGSDFVQLIGRHWKISSGLNLEDVQVVPAFSPGVIGLQPIIAPGETFHYTSCAVIKNKQGAMAGSFLMLNKTTEGTFEAVVEPFRLTPL